VDDSRTLPPIEDWWADLTIEARHAVLDDLHAPLHERVRVEIEHLTGRMIPEGTVLSAHEVGFVETQQQPVD